jgi:predicted metalloprotease
MSAGGFGGGFGGRSGGMPGGIGLPTGGLGLVLVIGFFLFTQFSSGGGGLSGFSGEQIRGADLSECDSGDDAATSLDCQIVGTVNSVQAFWADALPEQTRREYELSVTNLFSGSVTTGGCGTATSAVGPFYCPADQSVYIDTSFFDAMLERQLGAQGGDFAEAYVIAHEYGHHVQNLLGTMDQVRGGAGEDSDAVKLELQADCYAGMWAKYATTVEDENGEVFILELTEADIAEAIDAAETVGDDRIQQRAEGQVRPETWTHGSAAQRKEWFLIGLDRGTVDACDTFEGALG